MLVFQFAERFIIKEMQIGTPQKNVQKIKTLRLQNRSKLKSYEAKKKVTCFLIFNFFSSRFKSFSSSLIKYAIHSL